MTARTIMGLLTKRAKVSNRATHRRYNGARCSEILDARDARSLRGNRISMIFQEPMSSLNPVYTVGSQIVEAIRAHNKMSRSGGEGARARAARSRCTSPIRNRGSGSIRISSQAGNASA